MVEDPQALHDFVLVAQRIMDRYAQHALELGVTGPQMELLDVLADGPMPASSLADHIHCDPSNVTRLLDRVGALDGPDLVERRRSRTDRRVVEVGLTDHGRRTVAEHRRRRGEDVPLFAGLDAEQRASLAALLRRVAASLGDAPVPAAP